MKKPRSSAVGPQRIAPSDTPRIARLAVSVCLVLLAVSSTAWANSGITHSLVVDQIHVASDGESYVSASPSKWSAQITIDAGSVGKIKEYTYWVELEVEGMPTKLSLEPWAASKSYGVGNRPKTLNKINVGSIVSSALSPSGWFSVENFAKAVCGNRRAVLLAKGWSDDQIFSTEHKIAVQAIDRWDVEFSVDNYNDIIVEATYWFTEIVCLATSEMAGQAKKPPKPPEPASHSLAVPFQISEATIRVDPSQARGPCPMNLDVTAILTAVGKGTASFRLIHNGAPGPVRKVTFGKGGAKKNTATFQVGAPASGPGFKAAGGGGGQGGGTQLVTPTNPNQHSGHFAIHVVAPNKVESDEAFYSVSCVKKTQSSGPATIQARPTPTHEPGLKIKAQPRNGPSPQPGAPAVRLSPWQRDTCRGVRLEVEAGKGAASQAYETQWQRRRNRSWLQVRVAGFNRLHGPAVDTRVPRRVIEAAGDWRVRVRSHLPRGTWSGWEVLELAPCGAERHHGRSDDGR